MPAVQQVGVNVMKSSLAMATGRDNPSPRTPALGTLMTVTHNFTKLSRDVCTAAGKCDRRPFTRGRETRDYNVIMRQT